MRWCVSHVSVLVSLFVCLNGQTPVVIDTDIGSYIDDHFGIAFAVQSKYVQVKLIVTCSDDTTARAKVLAKLLTLLGRDDIPIGIGLKNDNKTHHDLFGWGADFNLSNYKGGVYADGVKATAQIILDSDSPVDIIAIGPMTNFPDLLTRYPQVVGKSRVYAMAGSVHKGYFNSSSQCAEYNVAMCPGCMQALLSVGWFVQLTPLDTCGTFSLNSSVLNTMLATTNKASLVLSSALLYYCVSTINVRDVCVFQGPKVHFPILYDAVAALLPLPLSKQLLVTDTLPLVVNATGFLVTNPNKGMPTSVALSWHDNGQDIFRNYLVQVIGN